MGNRLEIWAKVASMFATGPIVYRLGRDPLTVESGVRFPVGSPIRELYLVHLHCAISPSAFSRLPCSRIEFVDLHLEYAQRSHETESRHIFHVGCRAVHCMRCGTERWSRVGGAAGLYVGIHAIRHLRLVLRESERILATQ